MSTGRQFTRTAVAVLVLLISAAGCVNVKAPERITVGDHPQRIDSRTVPPTRSHEEARERLAEAYARNRYLEDKVATQERDKQELRAERDEWEHRYERLQEQCDRGDD